ncbi:ankyrin repeat domain-containing protein [Parendozoicomonas haliclonae]|uniref:Ankyrin repeats (3 copies) n=1 Tax=Parendozoicomonas haliclonae TaxID=1960125 RepID=A0A1X7AK37_9GAMM|nr:ankyrin repeat domain-containing protein [Parendozoicomonas haliclonae]SMA47523.1 Ankyrin repeats (3 copies) [Parendozoicomonas haliclonae]
MSKDGVGSTPRPQPNPDLNRIETGKHHPATEETSGNFFGRQVSETESPSTLLSQDSETDSGIDTLSTTSSSSLSERDIEVSYSDEFDPEEEQEMGEEFDQLVAENDYETCCQILQEYPWLLKRDPSCLSRNYDKNNNTWLHKLCQENDDAFLSQLFCYPPVIDALHSLTNRAGETPHHLLMSQRSDIMKMVAEDIDPSAYHQVDQLGKTPLHLAVYNDQQANCVYALRAAPELLLQEDYLGTTPLQQILKDDTLHDEDKQLLFSVARKASPTFATQLDKALRQYNAPKALLEQLTLSEDEELDRADRAMISMRFKTLLNNAMLLSCKSMVVDAPWLLERYPHALHQHLPDNPETLMHMLSEERHAAQAVQQAVTTQQGRNALTLKNARGLTPLHLMAQTPELLEQLPTSINRDPAFSITNSKGATPQHLACRGHSYECCSLMMARSPETLFIRDDRQETPFQAMIRNTRLSEQERLKLIEQAATVPGFQEAITSIRDTPFCNNATLNNRMAQLARRIPLPAKPVRLQQQAASTGAPTNTSTLSPDTLKALDLAVDTAKAQKNHTDSHTSTVDSLDLTSTVTKGNAQLEQQASQLVQKLGKVGVYGRFNCFPNESTKRLYSMGDENASLQLVRKLADLGTPTIQLRLSPPDEILSDNSPCLTDTPRQNWSPEQHLEFQRMREVSLHKLAILLSGSGFDPNNGVPQTFKLGDSEIQVVEYDQAVEDEPQLELGFSALTDKRLTFNKLHPNHYLRVAPYRFASELQLASLDIDGDHANVRPLNLPVNSIIPEQLSTTSGITSEHEWLDQQFTQLGQPANHYGEQLAQLCSQCRDQKIHTGVIYGTHHPKVSESNTLENWTRALKGQDKPTVLFINKSRVNPNTLHVLNRIEKVPILDLTEGEVMEQVKALGQQTGPALCLLPELPKPVFQHLIGNSDLPTLTEGANTTSHLLETGHTYLSLLPEGQTPIPQEIGYPLEALKAEAFSYKLSMSDIARECLEEAHQLAVSGDYAGAQRVLEHNSMLPPLFSSNSQQSAHDANGLNKPTIAGLLKKGAAGRLGEIEAQALLAALDVSTQATSQYIDSCLDNDSPTKNHYQMLQQHVGQAFNNSVTVALARFAQFKNLEL